MMPRKLVIQIQDPTLGKGWYKLAGPTRQEFMTDEELVARVRKENPDAMGVQITREY